MMKHMTGDLLQNVTRGLIVHGCNAQGVMGGGIALQVKRQYPAAFEAYRNGLESYRNMGMNPMGDIFVAQVADELFVVNAITQDKFGTDKRQVDYEALAQCFEKLKGTRMEVHYPMIGAGLAGGNWNIISTIIDETLVGCDHTLWTL